MNYIARFTMDKQDLLKFCRYYKGEKENPHPDGNDALFWGYESKWVDEMVKDTDFLSECITDYIGIGLSDFDKTDDTPLSLKALLFNRYCHWNSGTMLDCIKPFKDFYKNDYKREKAAD